MSRIVPGNAVGVAETVEALRRGLIVGLPTETVYGLAADLANDDAISNVFSVKGRPSSHPLIVHIARHEQLFDLAESVTTACTTLVAHAWPGPLTVVVRARSNVSRVVTGGQDTVAVRLPGHQLAQDVITGLGRPVAAPSANRFGRVSPTSAQHVLDDLGTDVPVILDGGNCLVGVESTIVDCTTAQPEILRHGSVTVDTIRDLLADIDVTLADTPSGTTRASGMLARHYAPKARLVLHENAADLPDSTAVVLRCDGDAVDTARHLFERLRELDRAGVDTAHVVLPPAVGLGIAIRDRLFKAAAHL